MESNREEAEKCLEIAKKYLRSGQKDKAKRLLEKSLRLFPLKDASGLLEALERNGASSAGNTENDEGHTRRRTRSEGKSSTEAAEDADYTKEQIDAVNRIKNCKDFYEILNVSKNAEEAELKKSYRKLALQFHPDKNKAPGATEAFKRIGTAFAVLSDPDKKSRYEEFGETLGPAQRQRRQYRDFEREFEDISPEDIFNMFFGGGYPTGRVYVHRRNRPSHHHHAHFHREEQNVPAYYPIMQLLPIFILVAFSLLSSLLVQDPPYSFHQNGNYIQPRVTGRYKIQFFVQKSFSNSYHGESLKQLERRIERDYIEKVQINCYKERQYKQEMLYQARVWGNHEMLRKAENMEMRSCQQFDDLMAQ